MPPRAGKACNWLEIIIVIGGDGPTLDVLARDRATVKERRQYVLLLSVDGSTRRSQPSSLQAAAGDEKIYHLHRIAIRGMDPGPCKGPTSVRCSTENNRRRQKASLSKRANFQKRSVGPFAISVLASSKLCLRAAYLDCGTSLEPVCGHHAQPFGPSKQRSWSPFKVLLL